MTTTHTSATAALGAVVLAARNAAIMLAAAEEAEWSLPPRQRPREDTTERSHGGPPSDPTADTATDPVRLRLRAEADAVRDALAECAAALHSLAADVADAHAALQDAYAAWRGIRPEDV